MAELDRRLRAAEGENRPRARPVTAAAPKRKSTTPEGEAAPHRSRPEGLSAVLWPALASFALVFTAGVYAFWLLHPGHQAAAGASLPHSITLSIPAVAVAWLVGIVLLPRLLPRTLAWTLLTAATVFVALYLSREVTAWLQAVLGQIPL